MAKDRWEADEFEGHIFVRCEFWHKGRKGGCMRTVGIVLWRDLKNQRAFLEGLIQEMQFDKGELIKTL